MIDFLIPTLLLASAPALLLALFYAALRSAVTDTPNAQRHWLLRGLGIGALAALVLALLKANTGIISTEFWDKVLMPLSLVSGLLTVLSLWGQLSKGRGLQRRLFDVLTKGRVASSIYAVFAASLVACYLRAVLLVPTGFVPPGMQIAFGELLPRFGGWFLALMAVALTTLAFVRVAREQRPRLLLVLFSITAGVTACSQIITLLQYLHSRGIVRFGAFFDAFVFFVQAKDYFVFLIMAGTFCLPVLLWLKNRLVSAVEGENPAQTRKRRAVARSLRRWSVVLVSCFVALTLCLTALKAVNERTIELSPIESASYVGQTIVIPLEQVNDGHLHRFAHYTQVGTEIRFIIILKNASSYGVGFDACTICGATGYYERDNEVVCKMCDVVMNKETIGFPGGCNPIPLAFTLSDGKLIVQVADLEAQEKQFS
jgi:uncharacterized membrane protein